MSAVLLILSFLSLKPNPRLQFTALSLCSYTELSLLQLLSYTVVLCAVYYNSTVQVLYLTGGASFRDLSLVLNANQLVNSMSTEICFLLLVFSSEPEQVIL